MTSEEKVISDQFNMLGGIYYKSPKTLFLVLNLTSQVINQSSPPYPPYFLVYPEGK